MNYGIINWDLPKKKVMILGSLYKHSYLKLFNTQLYLNVKKIANLKYSKIFFMPYYMHLTC